MKDVGLGISLSIVPINKLVDSKGEMLNVNKRFKEPLKEMVVWDVIKDTSPLNKYNRDFYNEKTQHQLIWM